MISDLNNARKHIFMLVCDKLLGQHWHRQCENLYWTLMPNYLFGPIRHANGPSVIGAARKLSRRLQIAQRSAYWAIKWPRYNLRALRRESIRRSLFWNLVGPVNMTEAPRKCLCQINKCPSQESPSHMSTKNKQQMPYNARKLGFELLTNVTLWKLWSHTKLEDSCPLWVPASEKSTIPGFQVLTTPSLDNFFRSFSLDKPKEITSELCLGAKLAAPQHGAEHHPQ